MQVKVFVAEEIHEGIVRGGARARRWEEHMNEWLSQHPQARVMYVRQSVTGILTKRWMISVWYEEAAA